jgi:hypothetical protein
VRASDDLLASSGWSADIPALLPAEDNVRILEGRVVEASAEGRYRFRVLRVTASTDLHVIGREVVLQLWPETIVYWIGHAEITVGTILLVPVATETAVDAGDILEPSEVDVQNAAGETF